MALDSSTIAIIGIVVAFVVTAVILLICFIIYCCVRIQDDTNIRKRILAKQTGGYAQEQVKTSYVNDAYVPPPPLPVPEPMPPPVPYIRRQEPYAPPLQPEVVVHEVVHRYEPTVPEIALPARQRLVRRNSWAASSNEEWVMVKRKKKRSPRHRRCDDSSSDEDDAPQCRCNHQYGSPRLAQYDLALPCTRCCVARPMCAVPLAPSPAVYGMARPPVTMSPMMISAVPVVGMTGVASTFQPTYGLQPQM